MAEDITVDGDLGRWASTAPVDKVRAYIAQTIGAMENCMDTDRYHMARVRAERVSVAVSTLATRLGEA